MYTEIKSYSIFLDSGSQKNRSFTAINLFNMADELIGVINFFEEEMEVNGPKNFDHIYLQFPYMVDVLRNEKPIFVGYWENKYGKYGRICTGKEPVGEGEIHTPVLPWESS